MKNLKMSSYYRSMNENLHIVKNCNTSKWELSMRYLFGNGDIILKLSREICENILKHGLVLQKKIAL